MQTEDQSQNKRRGVDRRQFLIRSSAAVSGLLFTSLSSCIGGGHRPENLIDSLEAGFADPPLRARPGAYWIWPDGYFDLDQITRELEDFKEKRLSGLEIFDIAARDDNDIVPDGPAFLSPEARQGYAHAIREASRLGLEMGFITSSSWNAGGPWVTPEIGSKTLYASETRVSGPGEQIIDLPYPEVPEPKFQGREGGLQPWTDAEVYSEEVAVLAVPAHEDRLIADVGEVVDLADRIQADGRLTWTVPPGDWVLLRMVCTNNRERMVLPSPLSDGYMIDHLSATATETHFRHIIDGLRETLGPLGDTALTYLYLPSYEVRGLTEWTPTFEVEFARRCGYGIRPFLPVLFGWTIANREESERVDHDRRVTISDLLIENHYGKAAEICHEAGLQLHAEAGGPGAPIHDFPAEALRALSTLDVPRGEFWVRNLPDVDDSANVIKAVASTAHIYGGQIAEMESFTCFDHWRRGPIDLKPYADRVLCEGVNRFIFHTHPHHPAEAGKPGWAYLAGTHVGMNRVWWPMATPFLNYLGRSSYLLQEGLFVADVCFYYGHDAPLLVPNKRFDENTASLGLGYDYDYVNSDVLLHRISVRDGRITLPDGMSYAVLVLPKRPDMPLEVLEKIELLVDGGATVVGERPMRTPGLHGADAALYNTRDAELRRLADQMWGDIDGQTVTSGAYGRGQVIQGVSLRLVLEDLGISPDFTFSGTDADTELDYIHRRVGDQDVYYIANVRARWANVDAVFRVTGGRPECWMPDTGARNPHFLYDRVEGGTRLHLDLPPFGSTFVIFSPENAQEHVVTAERNNRSLFPVTPGRPGEPPPVELSADEEGRVTAVAWRPGTYRLRTSGGDTLRLEIPETAPVLELSGPWDVRFPIGWGAPEWVILPELHSWTDHSDQGVKYFSGIATYQRIFEIPDEWLLPEIVIELDLGAVGCVARVSLNEQDLGIVWRPPYTVILTGAASPGENTLIVEVANVWANRLLGDRDLPENERFTLTNVPTDRQHDKLVPSGLLGPVQIRVGKKLILQR